MKRLILMLVLACSSFAAHGQQPPNGGSPCPPGMIPGYGKCYAPNDPDRFYRGSEVDRPAYTGSLWQDRYGAFAVDSATGSYGYSASASSKKAAFKAAIDDCGGGGCKVVTWVRNGCLAVASGTTSSYVIRADLKQAEAGAIERCSKNDVDGAACKIIYSACSLPVRVR